MLIAHDQSIECLRSKNQLVQSNEILGTELRHMIEAVEAEPSFPFPLDQLPLVREKVVEVRIGQAGLDRNMCGQVRTAGIPDCSIGVDPAWKADLPRSEERRVGQ